MNQHFFSISRLVAVMLAVTFGTCALALAAPDKKYNLKFSVTTSDTSSWTVGAKKFAELVEERTNGNVKIRVFPNDVLSGGNQAKGLEQLIGGIADFSFHSSIIYSVMDERFGIISLPFLFNSVEDADAKLAGPGGAAIKDLADQKGIVALAFGENGMRQLTTNKPIVTLDDMKGLKVRIPAMKMYTLLFTALGANPLTMNFTEVFTALQQGTIDGQENPLDTINSAKIQEVQKYLTNWDYSYDIIILGMNKKLFNTMSEDLQKLIQQAAVDACEYQKQINRERNENFLEQFRKAGMTINTLSPENREQFKNATQRVYDEYEPVMGKELIDLFR
ncbi:MAG: DctP family TRAP transporter solute-binding subunit [Candidatus Adiutrix sp.]